VIVEWAAEIFMELRWWPAAFVSLAVSLFVETEPVNDLSVEK